MCVSVSLLFSLPFPARSNKQAQSQNRTEQNTVKRRKEGGGRRGEERKQAKKPRDSPCAKYVLCLYSVLVYPRVRTKFAGQVEARAHARGKEHTVDTHTYVLCEELEKGCQLRCEQLTRLSYLAQAP